MKNLTELKQQLMSIRDNEWKLPTDINNYELVLEAMLNIGSTDPVLRDELILELIYKMIVEKDLTDKEIKHLMELALSEKHLFYKIGKKEDDSVFNRAFTVLLVGGMLNRHNNSTDKLFTEIEIKEILNKLLRYAREEKDVRGYVEAKGWVHTAAHTGDALREIALCKEIHRSELVEILDAIKEKICISYYTYKNNEDERLVSAIINIIQRKILREDEVINWIKGFENMNKTGTYPEDHYLISNHKNFLASLYFRLKRRDQSQCFLDAIEAVLNNTAAPYFK
jgi:tetratricopeptide (TPR) repeat protein